MVITERLSKETIGSRAFNLEYPQRTTDMELRDDIFSYLGEYRLQLQKYDYQLVFSSDLNNGYKLRDVYQGEPLSIKAERAMKEKRLRGEPTRREEAESKGILYLEDQLRFANSRDITILWVSPPGPREEGYGDYGFVYLGRADDTQLQMTAIRVEEPSIEQFNRTLSALSGQEFNFGKAEDFLQTPIVVHKKIAPTTVIGVLEKCFSFKVDEGEEEMFAEIKRQLSPLVTEFIYFTRHGRRKEKTRAFHALENFALELKERYRQKENEKLIYLGEYRKHRHLVDIIPAYGYQPTVALGSCGSTGEIKSNALLNDGYKALNRALFEENEWFTCPKCHYQADGPVGDTCPGCGLTKEEYAKESREVCG